MKPAIIMEREKVKVILVDDQPLLVDGLEKLLEDHPTIDVVAKAHNGQEALDRLNEHEEIDVVLLDIEMPVMDGIEATKRIVAKYENAKVLILTTHDEPLLICNLLDQKAAGYVIKSSRTEEIIEGIEKVANEGTYYGSKVLEAYEEEIERQKEVDAPAKPFDLSKREREILPYLAKEYTDKEVADVLFISKETASTHRKNIRRAIGARNTAGIVSLALRLQLVSKAELKKIPHPDRRYR